MEESNMLNGNISDDKLQLIVTEKKLGELKTNAKQIYEIVKESLPKYDIHNYNDDNIEQAKKDKASLNRAAKALNDKRIELENDFYRPFSGFKSLIDDTVSLIRECSLKIDGVVKANEQISRDKKMHDIQELFKSMNSPVILDKIFDQRWLNKSISLHKIEEEINKRIEEINSHIDYLKNLANDDASTFEALTAQYLITLDLNKTLDYFNQLKRQKEERAAEERAAEEKRKIEEEQQRVIENIRRNEKEAPFIASEFVDGKKEQVDTETGEIYAQNSAQNIPEQEDTLTRYFTVTCSKAKIIALSDFLNDNEIDFDKIEIEDTLCKTDRKNIISLLEFSSKFILAHASKTCEQDKVRLINNLIKKINNSFE